MDNDTKNHPEWNNPDPKQQISKDFSYVWMVTFQLLISILMSTRISLGISTRGGIWGFPKQGEVEDIVMERQERLKWEA